MHVTPQEQKIRKFFSQSRAQEIGKDVWEQYVIPPFYSDLDLLNAQKSKVVIGGRGSGKTMTLRFFSHDTMFSPKRTSIPDSALSHIGIYKRFDTQFCNMMHGRDIAQDIWDDSFRHYISLSFSHEILLSLESIARSALKSFDYSHFENLDFSPLQSFSTSIPGNFSDLKNYLRGELWSFESWVSNVRKRATPDFLSFDFLKHLIQIIQSHCVGLSGSIFYIYIDEFENLRSSQQSIINTYVKHSERPLIFNFAMKTNEKFNKKTCSDEHIIDPDDFRAINLDKLLRQDRKSFTIFAAEILLSGLQNSGVGQFNLKVELLKDPEELTKRHDAEYQARILSHVKRIFPKLSQKDLAQKAFNEPDVLEKLKERLDTALKEHDTSVKTKDFIDSSHPQASIIAPALLSRKQNTPEFILSEFEKLKHGRPSKFDDWVDNNFIACLLQLYHALQGKECLFYAGFETFCILANSNIRYLFVLCENSLRGKERDGSLEEITIPPEQQAAAARYTSARMLEEVKSFGSYGLILHQFVVRLGYIFKLDHQRLSLSENERNHFAITSEKEMPLSQETKDLLIEAEKWSVLYKREGTKKKKTENPDLFEYVLHPIFAPYFLISYRKKRRLELTAQDVEVLFNGKLEAYGRLLQRLQKSAPTQGGPTLFDDLLK